MGMNKDNIDIDTLYSLMVGTCPSGQVTERPAFDGSQFDTQIEGWAQMENALNEQITAMKNHVKGAKQAWTSKAGQIYFDRVDEALTAMQDAKDSATSNKNGWSKTREEVKAAFEAVADQKIAWDAHKKSKQDEYDKAVKEDEDKTTAGDLFGLNNPDEPDWDSEREQFDTAARSAVSGHVGEIEQIDSGQLQTFSPHQGPTDPGQGKDLYNTPVSSKPQTPGGGGDSSGPSGGGPDLQSPAPTPGPPAPSPTPGPAPTPGPPGPMPTPPPPGPMPRPTPNPTPRPMPRPTPKPTPPGPRPTPNPTPRPKPTLPGPRPTPNPTPRPNPTAPPKGGGPPPPPRPPQRTVQPVIGQRPGTGPVSPGMRPGTGPIAPGMRPGGGPSNAARPNPVHRSLQPPVIGGRQGGNGNVPPAVPGRGGATGRPGPNPAPGVRGVPTGAGGQRTGMDRGVFGTRQSKLGAAETSGAAGQRGPGVRAPVVRAATGDGLTRGVIRGAKQPTAAANTAPGVGNSARGRKDDRNATIDSDGPLDDVFRVNQTVVPGVIRGWTPNETEHTAGPAIGDRPGKHSKKKTDDDWDDW